MAYGRRGMATDVHGPARSAPELSPGDAAREPGHSGRLMLRIPPTLHAELARAAETERVSLNAYIIGVLAGTVAWRTPDGDDDAGQMPPWMRRTLLANLVVMAILAAVAVALVVVALLNG
jgi:HicB family